MNREIVSGEIERKEGLNGKNKKFEKDHKMRADRFVIDDVLVERQSLMKVTHVAFTRVRCAMALVESSFRDHLV